MRASGSSARPGCWRWSGPPASMWPPQHIVAPGDCHAVDGERAMETLLARPGERPTAIFCHTDELAFGAMAALRRHRVSCPEEISIAGFDDHPMSRFWGLTTVSRRARQQGIRAAYALVDSLRSDEPGDVHRLVNDLQVELVVRRRRVHADCRSGSSSAVDEIILRELAEPARATSGRVAVIDDPSGALVTAVAGAVAPRTVTYFCDGLGAERAVAAYAESAPQPIRAAAGLDADLLADVDLVALHLPQSLAALDEIAEAIVRHAAPGVRLVAGARTKHMTPAMNRVLRRHFGSVRGSLGARKCRALLAEGPLPADGSPRATRSGRTTRIWTCGSALTAARSPDRRSIWVPAS